jgi:methyl-accepting chemotaxis protein
MLTGNFSVGMQMETNMPHADHTPYKRKIRFIKKDFQFRFIFKFCLLVLAGTAISTGAFLFLSSGTLTSSFQDSRLVIKTTTTAVLPAVLYTNLITLSLITLATIVVTFIISHRLFGPLYRFEKDLEEIGKGNLVKKVRLRNKDELTDFVACINNMTNSLHRRVSDVESGFTRIIRSAALKDVPEEIIDEMKRIHREIGSNFKL